MIVLIWTVHCFGLGQVHTTGLLNFSALSNDIFSWDIYMLPYSICYATYVRFASHSGGYFFFLFEN